jgi:alanine-synthesizing transaminase
MVVSGDKKSAKDYIDGLAMLSSMRLCSNVPAQAIIQTALGGYQSINDLIAPGGRLFQQRDMCMNMLAKIPGVTCVRPKAAFYVFPRLDSKKFNIKSDEKFVLDFLHKEKVLLVAGKGFNWPTPDHFRIVFLPTVEDLKESIGRLGRFLKNYRQ